jgi:hypothetical protein
MKSRAGVSFIKFCFRHECVAHTCSGEVGQEMMKSYCIKKHIFVWGWVGVNFSNIVFARLVFNMFSIFLKKRKRNVLH